MVKRKISSNEVDDAAPMVGVTGDPIALTIDPNKIRWGNSIITSGSLFGRTPGLFFGGDDGGSNPGDPGSISKYLPQLSDISIVSETVDYSTMPPTIKLKLKIVNRTGSAISGIRAKVPS